MLKTEYMFTHPELFDAMVSKTLSRCEKRRENKRQQYLYNALIEVQVTSESVILGHTNDIARLAPRHESRAKFFRAASDNAKKVGSRENLKWVFPIEDVKAVAKAVEKVYGFCPDALLPYRCHGLEYTGPFEPQDLVGAETETSAPAVQNHTDYSDPSGKIAMICIGVACVIAFLGAL